MVEWQVVDVPLVRGLGGKHAEAIKPVNLLEQAQNFRQRRTGEFIKRYGYETLGRDIAEPSGDGGHDFYDANSIHARNKSEPIIYGFVKNSGANNPRYGEGFYRYSETTSDSHKVGPAVPCEVSTAVRSVVQAEAIERLNGHAHYSGASWAAKTKTHTVSLQSGASGGSYPNIKVRIYDALGRYIPCQSTSATDVITDALNSEYLGCVSVFTNSQNEFLIWYIDDDSDLAYYKIDMSAPQEYGAKTVYLADTISVLQVAHIDNDPDEHIIAYRDSAADLVVERIDASQTQVWKTTVLDTGTLAATSGGPIALYVDTTNDRVHVFHEEATTGEIYHVGLDLTAGGIEVGNVGLTEAASTGVTANVARMTVAADTQFGSNEVRIFYNENSVGSATDTMEAIVKSVLWDVSSQALTAAAAYDFNCQMLAGQAFTYNERAYAWMGVLEPDIPDNLLTLQGVIEDHTDTARGLVAAKAFHGLLDLPDGGQGVIPQSYEAATGKWCTTVAVSVNREAANVENQLQEICVDFRPDPLPSRQLGPSLQVAGGVMQNVSDEGTELGWMYRPIIKTVTTSAGGSMTGGGTYSWKAIFTWVDASGELHRSAPSNAATASASASDDYSITVYVPHLTVREFADCAVEIYISTVDGSEHYYTHRIQLADSTTVSASNQDPGSDTTIQGGALLYTDQGELPAGSPPPTVALARGGDRLMCIPSDNRRVVRYTKPKAVGVAPEWPVALQKSIFPHEDLTAVAFMDTRWVIFSPTEIFWFSGSGENAFAVGSFGKVNQIKSSGVGCIDRGSILEVEEGVVFKSRKGFSLLDRSLGLHYIGAGAEAYNYTPAGTDVGGASIVALTKVYSAIATEDDREYRFLVGADADVAGVTWVTRAESLHILVYDTYHKQWYIDRFEDTNNFKASEDSTVIDHVVADRSVWAIARTGSTDTFRLIREYNPQSQNVGETDDGLFKDLITAANPDITGENYDAILETGWFSPSKIHGYARCRRVGVLGEYNAEIHTLQLEVFTDGNLTTAAADKTWTVDAGNFSVVPYSFDVRLDAGKQKCSRVKVRITLSGSRRDNNKFATLSAVIFEVGLKSGMFKNIDARSA